MKKSEWIKLAATIQGRWPQPLITDEWLAAWWPIVADLTDEEALAALDTYSRQGNQWPPNGGHLWAVARGDASEAAQLVQVQLKLAAAHGGRQLLEGDPLHDVAHLLGGWSRLGRMDEEEWRYVGPQVREALHTIGRRDGAPLPAARG